MGDSLISKLTYLYLTFKIYKIDNYYNVYISRSYKDKYNSETLRTLLLMFNYVHDTLHVNQLA